MYFLAFDCLFFVRQRLRIKTIDQIFTKRLAEMYVWTRKSPLNIGRHPDLDPDPGIS